MKEFLGKVALITGAGSPRGIGRAVAERFAELGASLVLTDIASGEPDMIQEALGYRFGAGEGLDEAAAAAKKHGVDAITVHADVTQETDLEALVLAARRHYGRIDYLINVAGGSWGTNRIGDYEPAQWLKTLHVNLYGVFLATRFCLPVMESQGAGAVVNIASIAAARAHDMLSAYGAAKAGVVQFTRDLAAEYGPQGIRANAIMPGDIQTALNDMEMRGMAMVLGMEEDEVRAMTADSTPLRRMGQPQDVANLAAFLCSERASFITGAAIPLTGGRELSFRAH